MILKCLFFISCISLPTFLTAGIWDWFSSPSNSEKVEFACPHHCGEWGSESIRKIEWEFVQCLYDADRLAMYTYENFPNYCRESLEGWFRVTPYDFHFLRPQDFYSEWYQNMLEEKENGGMLLITPTNDDNRGAIWYINHIEDVTGKHVGKYFKRTLSRTVYSHAMRYAEMEDEDDIYSEDDLDEYQDEFYFNKVDWNAPRWDSYIEKNSYSFKTIIDFNNACLTLESDVDFLMIDIKNCIVNTISPYYSEILQNFLNFSNQMQSVRKSYQNIFIDCAKEHQSPCAFYNLALSGFQKGKYFQALKNIKALFNKINIDDLEPNLASNIYESKGKVEVEIAQYDEAISSLTKAIEHDPLNKEAYFERAIAYFETGKFELSLKDFLNKENLPKVKYYLEVCDFSKGIIIGGARGLTVATNEFLPSICSSVRGVGNLLWTTISHPIESPKAFAKATIDLCDFLRTCEKSELAKILVPEMYELIVDWDKLSYIKRGELAGYALGKYGTDLLLPIAVLKGTKYVKVLQELRKAEKLCTLEMLTSSPKSKEALTQAASRWNERRKDFFANVKLEVNQHTKHIPGAWNYEKGRGIMTYPEPQKLLSEYAGKGQKICGVSGEAGYRERVDFGKVIGYFIDEQGTVELSTTKGIIHYSKKGAHIVPADPR